MIKDRCQHCGKKATSDEDRVRNFTVHHIRYTPDEARAFICKKCHRNAHLLKPGYEVLWPLQTKRQSIKEEEAQAEAEWMKLMGWDKETYRKWRDEEAQAEAELKQWLTDERKKLG